MPVERIIDTPRHTGSFDTKLTDTNVSVILFGLFTSSKEVIESWRILDAIQKTWEKSGDDLIFYKKGSAIEEVFNL